LHEQKSSEEEVVKDISALVVALGVTPWLPVVAQSAEQAAQSEENGDAAKVSGSRGEPRRYAVCVNPVGAPVDPPPVSALQPCKRRAHYNGARAVYPLGVAFRFQA
jgi:hypothetical protein